MTNRAIGDELNLAEKTVKNYVSQLLAKLGMERRTQAAAYLAPDEGEADPLSRSGLPAAGRSGGQSLPSPP